MASAATIQVGADVRPATQSGIAMVSSPFCIYCLSTPGHGGEGWAAGAGWEVAKITPAAAVRLPSRMRAPKTSFVTLGEKLLTFRYHST
ncbi:hypothetical protein GCM10010176_069170 [Nonomuraea spiralis]|nr:hypothetical protein GCM10010176_069170 [Nonomuraea spiralis]